MNVTFDNPNFLMALVVLPFLLLLHFLLLHRRRKIALKFANFEAIARIKGVDLLSKNITLLFLTAVTAAALILALSGMQLQTTMDSSSFSFVIALDASRSMEANDMLPTRFEVAKKTALDFVQNSAPGTRIGVISFAGNAFIEQEVLDDREKTADVIRKIPMSAVGGTDLYEAVLTGTTLLKNEESRAIILLSDGRINVGNVGTLIDYANANSVMVHTIGIGTIEGGNTTYGMSTVDEETLKAIALNTQGTYHNARNSEELERAFQEILALKMRKVSFHLEPYLIGLSLILIILQFILFNTRFSSIP